MFNRAGPHVGVVMLNVAEGNVGTQLRIPETLQFRTKHSVNKDNQQTSQLTYMEKVSLTLHIFHDKYGFHIFDNLRQTRQYLVCI